MLAYSSLSVTSANSFPAIANSWVIACSLTAIYFVPALVAFFRRQQNRWLILVLNFLFGWTMVGWIICLAWAARAPAGEPVVVVQTVPPVSPGPMRFFRRKSSTLLSPPVPNVSESVPFQTEEISPERHPHSFKMVLFRLAIAAISLAVVAGVTASQWKNSNSSELSRPRHRIYHVPQIRNIDPYRPSLPSATPQRRYLSPPGRSLQGYY
jgi:Superinfection immunity protein